MSKKKGPYNPLDKANLGRSVAEAILNQPYQVMPPKPFEGIGIYAIYYFGNNPIYAMNSRYNQRNDIGWPIYIGKAIATGGRKGILNTENSKSKNLYNRIRKHANTIDEVENLNLKDFKCKYLTIDSIWIPLGEQLLIDRYKPLWNSIIDGFGNNDPGSRRYSGNSPEWHLLHRGVSWAKKMTDYSESPNVDHLVKKLITAQEVKLSELNKK